LRGEAIVSISLRAGKLFVCPRSSVPRYSALPAPEPARTLDLLAALSRQANFSVGCYCESEAHCHRSVLRALLVERGGKVV